MQLWQTFNILNIKLLPFNEEGAVGFLFLPLSDILGSHFTEQGKEVAPFKPLDFLHPSA